MKISIFDDKNRFDINDETHHGHVHGISTNIDRLIDAIEITLD